MRGIHHLEKSKKKKHLFSRHPFATDVPPLLDGPITALYLYRASAAEVYICKQKLELLGFEHAVVSTVYGDVSKISREFRGERSCWENRTSRWTTPGASPAPPVREQQEAQATFSPDSPNQVSYRSEKCGLVWWISIAETSGRRRRAENVALNPSSSVLMVLTLFKLHLSFNADLYTLYCL